MPKAGKRTREDLKGYDSDGDSISPDDGPQKRSKPTQASKAHNDGESRDKSWEVRIQNLSLFLADSHS